MNFDDLQSLWNEPSAQHPFTINESALTNLILSKKVTSRRIANRSELLLAGVNLSAGTFILYSNLTRKPVSVMLFVLGSWMIATAVFVLVHRVRRTAGQNQFDRSMKGELSNAIAVATYQVWLSGLMRWNVIPVAAFVVFGLWEVHMSYWIGGAALVVFVAAFFGSKWEHSIYVTRRKELDALSSALTGNEDVQQK